MVLTIAALKGGPQSTRHRPVDRRRYPSISLTCITAGLRRGQVGPGFRPVHELVSPENRVYVMQSYAHIVDDTLTEDALSRLAERLTLPAGWQYRVRRLDAEFVVRTVGGRVCVIQSGYEDMHVRIAR